MGWQKNEMLDEGLSPGFSIDCTSHFTAWPPLAPRALAGGEGGGGVRGPTARIARDGLMIVE
jgi:hypothetical protein